VARTTPAKAAKKPARDSEIDALLRSRGLRRTNPRVAVLQLMFAHPKPWSHGDITAALEPAGHDRATVYRNLMDLAEANILVRSDLGDHIWRFSLRLEHDDAAAHAHFVCTDCGGVTCLPEASVTVRPSKQAPKALRKRDVVVHVRGLCDACA
jgi:Fur family ferric uptake transcriptional regulator